MLVTQLEELEPDTDRARSALLSVVGEERLRRKVSIQAAAPTTARPEPSGSARALRREVRVVYRARARTRSAGTRRIASEARARDGPCKLRKGSLTRRPSRRPPGTERARAGVLRRRLHRACDAPTGARTAASGAFCERTRSTSGDRSHAPSPRSHEESPNQVLSERRARSRWARQVAQLEPDLGQPQRALHRSGYDPTRRADHRASGARALGREVRGTHRAERWHQDRLRASDHLGHRRHDGSSRPSSIGDLSS